MMPVRMGAAMISAARSLALLGLSLAAIGAAYPGSAEADFRTVPGRTERSGPGTLFRYVVKVQQSIHVGDRRLAREITGILFDDRSWSGTGEVAFQRMRRNHNTEILLARPNAVDRLCAPLATNGRYSCTKGSMIVLNLDRWRRSVSHWRAGLGNYRRMLVNHEMGHRLGMGHRYCPRNGEKAPVMQQQSIGLQGCRPNWWPKKPELDALRRMYAAAAATRSDGFVE